MCSLRSFEAKANKPNGPIVPLLAAYSWLQSSWGSTPFGSRNSAFSSSGTSNNTSTSAFKSSNLKALTIDVLGLKFISENIESIYLPVMQ